MTGYWTIPAGWEWKPLPEVAEIVASKGQGQAADGPFYNLMGDPWKQPEVQSPIPGARTCDKTCVLVGKSKKELKVVVPASAGLASRGWTILQPKTGIDREYLAWCFRAFAQLVPPATWAAAIPSGLQELLVPYPVGRDNADSLSIQRRIAAQFDDQMQEWLEARRLCGQIKRDVETLVAAAVQEVFSTPAAEKWTFLTLGDVADFTGGLRRNESAEPDAPRFLDIGAISKAKAGLHEVHWHDLGGWKAKWGPAATKHLLQEGDLLLERCGDATGRVHRLTGHIPKAVCSESIFVLRSYPGYDQGFLYWILRSPAVQASVATVKREKVGVRSVSGESFKTIEVHMPTLHEQQRLAGYLDGIEEQAIQMVRQQRETAQFLERIPTALYHAVFVEAEA